MKISFLLCYNVTFQIWFKYGRSKHAAAECTPRIYTQKEQNTVSNWVSEDHQSEPLERMKQRQAAEMDHRCLGELKPPQDLAKGQSHWRQPQAAPHT